MTELARRARGHLYRALARTGRAPRVSDLAPLLGADVAEARAAMAELDAAHAVILDRDGELEWALPFSAVPTPYRVTSGHQAWHTPCAWDALSLGPLLQVETVVHTTCADCGTPIRLSVTPAHARLLEPLPSTQPVVHFARQASEWWADIRET